MLNELNVAKRLMLRYVELGTGILIHIPDLRKDLKEIRKD
jgi:hypothetical protein